jgi:hypothetical protein
MEGISKQSLFLITFGIKRKQWVSNIYLKAKWWFSTKGEVQLKFTVKSYHRI